MRRDMTKRVYAICHNKDSDQPLDSIIPIDAISTFSRLYLSFIAEQAGLSLTWSQTSEDSFLRDVAQICSIIGAVIFTPT